MSIDIEKLNRTRKRANRSLRTMQLMWLPLILAYTGWLIALGHEAAKWFGALMAVLVGTAYPFVIAISLSVRSIKPFPMREPAGPPESSCHLPSEEISLAHCVFCGSDDVVVTRCCGKLACPAHRIGTGTLSDGFCCNDHPFGV